MRGAGLALLLVLLVLLVAAGEGRGEGTPVRLCGRDFVRAVVFTCGGSRWRRHVAGDRYLLESDNPLPFSQENNGYTDPAMDTDQGLEPGSQETHRMKPEAEQDPPGTRKTWMLRKREAAKLLTTSCCSVGCSEREISSLC
ncbi:insulin-like peptide INSL5 [Apus apus]|uniref:insulin-like peptide INSL5 n=1 Tax=Apus apus TaxID=8895 RepID=UPI0021F87AF4|nr:insulin-like peptide INSL5 [Apus apus]